MSLNTAPNLESADEFYEALIDAHQDLDSTSSHALNARLVLLLANHIGRLDVLRQALSAARDSATGSGQDRDAAKAPKAPAVPATR